MDYANIYKNLMKKARARKKPPSPTEDHHIWPTSLGGPNTTRNLVTLTLREHFFAHLLLWKFLKNMNGHNKMSLAVFMMSGRSMSQINSRVYATIRSDVVNHQSFMNTKHMISKAVLSYYLTAMSVTEISVKLNIPTNAIRRRMELFDLSEVHTHWHKHETHNSLKIERDWLQTELLSKSAFQITKELGISNGPVYTRIKRWGLQTPHKHSPTSGRPKGVKYNGKG